MNDAPRRGFKPADVAVAGAIVVVFVIALTAHGWRFAATSGGVSRGDLSGDTAATLDPKKIPELIGAKGRRHASPFPDSITARAEQQCVTAVEAQIGFQLKAPFAAKVMAIYGVGDTGTGAGDSLDIDGIGRTPDGRVSAWHCAMANLGRFAGSPFVTHVEKP